MQHQNIFGAHKRPGITGGHGRYHHFWKTNGKFTHHAGSKGCPHRATQTDDTVDFILSVQFPGTFNGPSGHESQRFALMPDILHLSQGFSGGGSYFFPGDINRRRAFTFYSGVHDLYRDFFFLQAFGNEQRFLTFGVHRCNQKGNPWVFQNNLPNAF